MKKSTFINHAIIGKTGRTYTERYDVNYLEYYKFENLPKICQSEEVRKEYEHCWEVFNRWERIKLNQDTKYADFLSSVTHYDERGNLYLRVSE